LVNQPTRRERLRLASPPHGSSDSIFKQPRQIARGLFPAPGRRLRLSARGKPEGDGAPRGATLQSTPSQAPHSYLRECSPRSAPSRRFSAFRGHAFYLRRCRRHISEPVAGGRSASGRPRCRPGIVVARHEPQAPHPAPPLRRLAMAPSDEPGDMNIVQ
jgi:hypothetical protein